MKTNKRALILGVTGQDGAHLAAQLLSEGWNVFGGFRRGSSANTWRLEHLDLMSKVNLINISVDEPLKLLDAFKNIQPDHIYHLAGESFVADSFAHPVTAFEVNSIGTLHVLEAMRRVLPKSKLFFASSSEVFGRVEPEVMLDEDGKLQPSNPYGISKLAAQQMVQMYRQSYGLFASVGILFNHEGPLRARNFVTRKITSNLARLKLQGGDPIELGNFNSARDWGAAEDFTRAMMCVMHLDQPEDFVFATGKLTSVKQFLTLAAIEAGFIPDFQGKGKDEVCFDVPSGLVLARISERYFRTFDTSARRGNNTKLKNRILCGGFRAIEVLAAEMVKADIERWEKGIRNI